jgi:hypothetical protein
MPDGPPNRKEGTMSIIESKTSLSNVSARVDHAEALSAQSNMRLVAIMNALEIARGHGGHKTWSESQADALRAMIKICDRVADGSELGPRIAPA